MGFHTGEEMARGILEAYAFAASDPYRAVTHNKGTMPLSNSSSLRLIECLGVMNGVDAAAVALGQDFRALEAGAHAWASRNGNYRPLTAYRLVRVLFPVD
jgi:hydroxymethylglutaryl-CoA reductase